MSDKLRIKPISCALTRKPIYDKVEFASPKSSDNVARARGKKK
jgi:hypothetical protein